MSISRRPLGPPEPYHAPRPCALCANKAPPELVYNCTFCSGFYISHTPPPADPYLAHHPNTLVFIDGACFGNGTYDAVSGLGMAWGLGKDQQLSVPVDDAVDDFPKRSNQRAELMAAVWGLKQLARRRDGQVEERPAKGQEYIWTIATDSEYVMKGMTEWVPLWLRNAWRKSDGRPPTNVDLFQKLYKMVEELDREKGVWVVFWHVPRVYNKLADSLAKKAAGMEGATRARSRALG